MDAEWIDSRCKYVDKRAPASNVIGWLRGESNEAPVILDGRVPYAIVDPGASGAHRLRPETHVEKVSRPAPCLTPDDDEAIALAKFRDSGAHYLPVRDHHHKPLGIVNVMRVLEALDDGPGARAAAHYAPPARPTDSINHVAHLFSTNNCAHLPVIDGQGRILGSIARTAVFKVQEGQHQSMGKNDFGAEANDAGADDTAAYMDPQWNTIAATATYAEVVKKLAHGTVFVTRGDRYAGVLDGALLVKAMARREQLATNHLGVKPHYRRPRTVASVAR